MKKDVFQFKVILILKYGILIDIKNHGVFFFNKNNFSEKVLKDFCYKAELELSDKSLNESLFRIIRNKNTKYATLTSEPNILGSFFYESEKADKSRIMIKDSVRDLFSAGDKHHFNNKDLYVSNVGRSFEANEGAGKVCYVYLEETTKVPNWTIEAYMEHMENYALMIKTIKTEGVKPRHSVKISDEIKNAKEYFDFRKKIIGNTWFAVSEDYIYFISSDTAINEFSYNIKINGQLFQVWQMHKGIFPFREEVISEMNKVLMESNIFPNEVEKNE